MSWIILVVLILVLISVVISLSRLKLYINIRMFNKTFGYQLDLKLYGIIILRKKKTFNPNENPDSIIDLIEKNDLSYAEQFLSYFGKRKYSLIKRCYVQSLDWQTDIGVGEAYTTSILTGVIWTFKGTILALMDTYVKDYNKPQLKITPHFNTCKLETNFDCMISIGLGQAILRTLKK